MILFVKMTEKAVGGKTIATRAIGTLRPFTVTRCTVTSGANKVSGSTIASVGTKTTYKTYWQPVGVDGHKVRIQGVFGMRTYSTGVDTSTWLDVGAGDLIQIMSTNSNYYSQIDHNSSGIDILPISSNWYVESITIKPMKGYKLYTQIELNLLRRWGP